MKQLLLLQTTNLNQQVLYDYKIICKSHVFVVYIVKCVMCMMKMNLWQKQLSNRDFNIIIIIIIIIRIDIKKKNDIVGLIISFVSLKIKIKSLAISLLNN